MPSTKQFTICTLLLLDFLYLLQIKEDIAAHTLGNNSSNGPLMLGVKRVLFGAWPVKVCVPTDPASSSHFVIIRSSDCDFDSGVPNAHKAECKMAIVHNVSLVESIRMRSFKSDGFTLLDVLGCVGIILGRVIWWVILMREDEIADYLVQYILRWRSSHVLKKFPVHNHKKGGDADDVCAICLEEYEEGDMLRALPCSHAFHSKCVDYWLYDMIKTTCPLCTQEVWLTVDDEE